MLRSQQLIVAAHAQLAQGKWAGKPVDLVEDNGNNITWDTEEFTKLYGWGNRYPHCAQGCTVVGVKLGLLAPKDGSASAWGFTDHLGTLPHGAVTAPEVGAQVSIAAGAGHVFTLLQDLGGGKWRTGEFNYGNRYTQLVRDIPATPLHSMARYPGVAAEMFAVKPSKPKTTTLPGWISQRRRPVKIGDAGGHVQHIKVLLGMGRGDTGNGIYDAKTSQWVSVFQQHHGLHRTGQVDDATAIALENSR